MGTQAILTPCTTRYPCNYLDGIMYKKISKPKYHETHLRSTNGVSGSYNLSASHTAHHPSSLRVNWQTARVPWLIHHPPPCAYKNSPFPILRVGWRAVFKPIVFLCHPYPLSSSEAQPPLKQVCLPSRHLLKDLYFREAGRAKSLLPRTIIFSWCGFCLGHKSISSRNVLYGISSLYVLGICLSFHNTPSEHQAFSKEDDMSQTH